MLPALDLIVNRADVSFVLNGKKCASMIQADFRLGQSVNFSFHPNQLDNKTRLFARGKIVAGIGLRINHEKETIEKWTGFVWKPCDKNHIVKIIANEGLHPDDFWSRSKETYQVNQIYFDITKRLV